MVASPLHTSLAILIPLLYSDITHYVTLRSHITKCQTPMSFSNAFPQQCQRSFYTTWEKSLDQNILDMQIQQQWFCSKTSHDHSLHNNKPLQYQTYWCPVMDMRQDGAANIDWMEQHYSVNTGRHVKMSSWMRIIGIGISFMTVYQHCSYVHSQHYTISIDWWQMDLSLHIDEFRGLCIKA